MSGFKDYLAQRKAQAGQPATPKQAETAPSQQPPNVVVSTNTPSSATPKALTYQCGHPVVVKNLLGSLCGPCKQEAQRAKRQRNQAKREARQEAQPPRQDHGRLPGSSTFTVVYDAETQTWSGCLAVPNSTLVKGTHSNVFKLLACLDALWRTESGKVGADGP